LRKPVLKPYLNSEEIKNRMKEAKDKREYRRWQALYLIEKKGMNADEVADLVDVCPHTIHQWVYYYNKKGPEGLVIKGHHGGNRALMTEEEEIEFLREIQQEKGFIITPQKIKNMLEKKLGHPVSKDFPYDLLHRHGWKKGKKQVIYEKDFTGKAVYKKRKNPGWQPPGAV